MTRPWAERSGSSCRQCATSSATGPRSSLPTRVPGAHLPKPGAAPEGGWFGTDVQWPIEDPDVNAAVHYLRHSGLQDGPETEDLLERVLDGVKRIGKAR